MSLCRTGGLSGLAASSVTMTSPAKPGGPGGTRPSRMLWRPGAAGPAELAPDGKSTAGRTDDAQVSGAAGVPRLELRVWSHGEVDPAADHAQCAVLEGHPRMHGCPEQRQRWGHVLLSGVKEDRLYAWRARRAVSQHGRTPNHDAGPAVQDKRQRLIDPYLGDPHPAIGQEPPIRQFGQLVVAMRIHRAYPRAVHLVRANSFPATGSTRFPFALLTTKVRAVAGIALTPP